MARPQHPGQTRRGAGGGHARRALGSGGSGAAAAAVGVALGAVEVRRLAKGAVFLAARLRTLGFSFHTAEEKRSRS